MTHELRTTAEQMQQTAFSPSCSVGGPWRNERGVACHPFHLVIYCFVFSFRLQVRATQKAQFVTVAAHYCTSGLPPCPVVRAGTRQRLGTDPQPTLLMVPGGGVEAEPKKDTRFGGEKHCSRPEKRFSPPNFVPLVVCLGPPPPPPAPKGYKVRG